MHKTEKARTPSEANHIGWRLAQLRIRRGLQQSDVSRLTGFDRAYVSRVESGRHSPRPDNVNKILDAIGATPDERNAVYHVEIPPPTSDEIARQVAAAAAKYEDDLATPVVLLDCRWHRWYVNRALRAARGLTRDEYERAIGENVLIGIIREDSPVYGLYPDEDRVIDFLKRASSFRALHATEEFDRWYLEVVEQIEAVPWAAELWRGPESAYAPPFVETHIADVLNPQEGRLRFRGHMSHLMADPRFMLLQYTPADEETSQKLRRLCELPEYSYRVKGDI